MGTVRYLSPEQARGGEVTERTDQYALAATLWEMLTGAAPYEGEGLADTLRAIVHDPPAQLEHLRPDLAPRLRATLERALSRDPRARFSSVVAFASELRDAARDAVVDAYGATVGVPGRSPRIDPYGATAVPTQPRDPMGYAPTLPARGGRPADVSPRGPRRHLARASRASRSRSGSWGCWRRRSPS